MKTRTVAEIDAAFREMGLTEKTWGKGLAPSAASEETGASEAQIFIRTDTATTPLKEKVDADLAQSSERD